LDKISGRRAQVERCAPPVPGAGVPGLHTA